MSRSIAITLEHDQTVAGLLLAPPAATTCFVFAHGAGAGMEHEFMQSMSERLAEEQIATLRYQFPYMQARSSRPDRPSVCHAAVRAAVAAARASMPQSILIAGGKSFGGRMTSQAQALHPLEGVAGLAFFGFPWHVPKKPSRERSQHLDDIHVPMLFLQGARDPMGDPELIAAEISKRCAWALLESVADADHGFHVPVKSGRTDLQVRQGLARRFAEWVIATQGPGNRRGER